MDTQSRELNIGWIPASGFQLRKAGVQFDAVRIEGEEGRRVAETLEAMTGGDPGPIVVESKGVRAVYFLVPAGSTSFRPWPRGVTTFNSGPGKVSYVPVPALSGETWPVAWWRPPIGEDRFVHPVLLKCVAEGVLV
ncbi:hypothetical protein [Streptomyces sp. NPDC048442]|uniref:hypothetical protein n=1 Tax=Streptomyces sp. NPDC048442 TaxID=3154823 RepID=UPI00341EE92C